MPDVVKKAQALSDEHKRDQMLADNLYSAVAEIVQGQIAGDITRYLVRKGRQAIVDMCENVERFTGLVATLETAVESDGELR